METGVLVAVQESTDYLPMSALVERVLPDGTTIRVQEDIDPARLANFKHTVYSSYVVDLICEMIAEGQPLTKICGSPGFPTYSQFCRWKRLDPTVQYRIDEARRDRAERLRDMAYSEALNIENDTVASDKARFEALMRLAGVDDKERFGNARGSTDAMGPIQIMINTGIVREVTSGGDKN